MVPVFNKEFFGWFLITLKLNQTVNSGWAKALKPEWVISINEKLDKAQRDDAASAWAKQCIYRIPQCLREVADDKAYIPQIVSLGPYHHGKKRLRNMDRHKWRALHQVLERNGQQIELYLDAVKELEKKARACYEGPICLSSNEFVEMMVLDACFVLELFRVWHALSEGDLLDRIRKFKQLGYSINDPIFSMHRMMQLIQRDMIMLENQIPLFMLDKLFQLQPDQTDRPDQKGVAELALSFFNPLTPTPTPTDAPLTKKSSLGHYLKNTFPQLMEHGGLHCLEVFRRSLLPIRAGSKPEHQVADDRKQQRIDCVRKLKESGIKFKKRETDRFWDIEFKDGVLEIPPLLIEDGTKSLFLNLTAYEQCHLNCPHDITSYLMFMDDLINSAEDVSYLQSCGIIENWLGSDAEVAELFNGLGQEVVFKSKDSLLSRQSQEVKKYCGRKWNTWRASLKRTYFNNPWSSISVVAAVVLLLLTLAQTIYSAFAYHRPRD